MTLVTIHIEMGSFLLGEFTICIKQVQLNGFQLSFNSTFITKTFKSRYFTGFDCFWLFCTEFVSIRLVMVVDC